MQLLEPRRQLMDESTNLIEMECSAAMSSGSGSNALKPHVPILLLSLANNQPPATAGTMLTSSPSAKAVAWFSKKRMSSLLT